MNKEFEEELRALLDWGEKHSKSKPDTKIVHGFTVEELRFIVELLQPGNTGARPVDIAHHVLQTLAEPDEHAFDERDLERVLAVISQYFVSRTPASMLSEGKVRKLIVGWRTQPATYWQRAQLNLCADSLEALLGAGTPAITEKENMKNFGGWDGKEI